MKRWALLVGIVHLMQCRPIDLGPGWMTLGNDTENVTAKIVCQCDATGNAVPVSYSIQTRDIRQTCSEGDHLCESACQPSNLTGAIPS